LRRVIVCPASGNHPGTQFNHNASVIRAFEMPNHAAVGRGSRPCLAGRRLALRVALDLNQNSISQPVGVERSTMAERKSRQVWIGKFAILATYTFAKALGDGMPENEAKRRGMVAAIMGAHTRLGIPHEHKEFESLKEAAEKRKKTTITPELFDRQAGRRILREGLSSGDGEVR
jgi:hypothetical protein